MVTLGLPETKDYFAVVKTRLQVTPKPGDPIYRGISHAWRYGCVALWRPMFLSNRTLTLRSEIVRNEGVRALFKGTGPRVMIVSVSGMF